MLDIYETNTQYIDLSHITLEGRILDIGGGGEGIISRHSGDRVVAIDNRKEELEETRNEGLKIVMDACDLKFLDQMFDTVTCFYTLMYMDEKEILQCLCEAHRILKPGGLLRIWDSTIPTAIAADIYVAQLEVKISRTLTLTTGYGVRWNRSQSAESVQALCERAGFLFASLSEQADAFALCMQKDREVRG